MYSPCVLCSVCIRRWASQKGPAGRWLPVHSLSRGTHKQHKMCIVLQQEACICLYLQQTNTETSGQFVQHQTARYVLSLLAVSSHMIRSRLKCLLNCDLFICSYDVYTCENYYYCYFICTYSLFVKYVYRILLFFSRSKMVDLVALIKLLLSN